MKEASIFHEYKAPSRLEVIPKDSVEVMNDSKVMLQLMVPLTCRKYVQDETSNSCDTMAPPHPAENGGGWDGYNQSSPGKDNLPHHVPMSTDKDAADILMSFKRQNLVMVSNHLLHNTP